jgi:DNA polymerase-3 subunit alpha
MNRDTPKLKFVGLHAHSVAGSPFDALGYPQDHMDAAWDRGMDALALTDHGNMNGLSWQVEHAKKMKKEGKPFKPIFGCEVYYIPSVEQWRNDYDENKKVKKSLSKGVIMEDGEKQRHLVSNSHFLLLAKNQVGLNNLYKLVSDSYSGKNFFRKPRVDLEALRKHSEGIIATTTCISGPFAKIVWNNSGASHFELMGLMRPVIEDFLDIFGEDYYGEVQWNNIPEQHILNKCVIELSKEYGFKLISTVDSHYPKKNDWTDRELYKRLGWLGMARKPAWITDEIPKDVNEIGYELYVKNGDQVYESYKKYSDECGFQYDDELIKESIENTHAISEEKIEDFLPDSTVRLPGFVVPEGKTDNEALLELCVEGAKNLHLDLNKEYMSRLEHEIRVISARGFSKYFLTMRAIADKASTVQLVGAGRGSAAGSLVAYVLGITQVDPIKWGLLFSRFLREDATDYPDIDYDVSDPMALKEMLIEEWGDNVVVPISNWNTLQLRSLIKDISKFYDIPFSEVNPVTGAMLREATTLAKKAKGIIAGVYTPTFEEVMMYSETLQRFLVRYPHVKEHVEKIYGQVRSCSRHAGGVVIGEELDKHMPLINSGGIRQTPWSEGQNVRHLEPMGFIKFDILGLASLRMMESAIRSILIKEGTEEPTFKDVKEYYNKNLHPDVLDLDDQNVYENIFHKGKWAGVFQFTEKGAQGFCRRAKPNSLIDISAITSIFRPGPLSAGVGREYISAKEGQKHVDYIHPIVDEVTKETHGFLIFQEQIALLAHKLGKDISLDEGNKLRKLLIKRGTGKGHEEKDKIYKKFIRGCAEKRILNSKAEELWRNFEYFSGYGFNKSHAVSYSLLSYQCAYLLNYHPTEWVTAFLDKEPESRKEKAIAVVKGLGFDIRTVDINYSERTWTILGERVLVQPLSSIKGLGDKAIDQILKHRPFKTVEEFLFDDKIVYSKLNKKALDVLCRSGALDSLIDKRFTGGKHFWSAIAVDRPRKLDNLKENIKTYKKEGEFTDQEKVEYLVGLTGMYPFHLVVNKDLERELQGRPALSEFYTEGMNEGAVWFVVREKIEKKTKNGKTYWILQCIDPGGMTSIKCWGVRPEKDKVKFNKPYAGKVYYSSEWGFSARAIGKTFIPLSD